MKKKYVITLVLMVSLLFTLFVIQLNEPKLQLSPSIGVARIITSTDSVTPFVTGVLIVGITGTLILINIDK